MHKIIKTIIFKKKKQKIVLISLIFFSVLLFNLTVFSHISHVNTNINNTDDNLEKISPNPESANNDSVIFEGIEPALNITDYGVLYEKNQYISVLSQEKLNLSYYLDDVHDWKASKIENTIKNIQDKRNWINNSGFLSPTIYRVYGEWNTTHPYQQNNNIVWGNPDHEIIVSGATYIRVHFTEVFFEPYYDFLYLTNGTNIYYVNSSGDTDFYSPWLRGEIFRLYYYSNNINEYFGYYIDYYEYVNSTSNIDINSNDWEFKYQEVENGFNYNGVADVNGSNAMYIALIGEYVDTDQFDYDTGAFSEIYQEFEIPSGPFVDAYLSFDYYCQYALPTNDHYIYVKLNDQKIFSKGMLDISDLGKRKWLSSGKLHIDAWDNKTQIFDENLYQQSFNISLGFKIGAGYLYTGMYDEGLANIIYFDNISLTVTSKANSTQNFIDLRINGDDLDDLDKWGYSNKSIMGLWDSNPVILSLNSSSPHLTFDMNTSIYGYRNGTSKINQQGSDGISYQILNNGTIYWEFLHNLYIPTDYTDNSFIIEKPREWNFKIVKDPTLKNIPFEFGKSDEQFLKINKTFALYPGWWYFKATSPNYLTDSNTKFFKQGQWVESANFTIGESTRITTQLSNMGKIPKDTSQINLTIYHPNGTIFFTESSSTDDGNVTFSQITFNSFNTVGGIYEYTLFWNNGTALGGIKSNFIVKHNSTLLLLKPNDAKLDLRTEGFVGDIIPLRILLKDAENNLSISNSLISYNWTNGTKYFTESASGIYETVLDTSDLLSRGLYNIVIKSSKLGFFTSILTLEINLGEETNLQVLESDYNIELHANGTIKFKLTDFDEDPIDGALVDINLDNPSLYTVSNPGNGIYNIEFSTVYINEIGIYQLRINFSAVAYEPQYYTFQFQIIKQSVNLSVYINSHQIDENNLENAIFNEELNISARAISNIDQEYLTGGTITYISENYEKNIPEQFDFWYNTSIICSPDNFSFGKNLVYLKFEHSNYSTVTFAFQLLVDQLEINVSPISFKDSISAEIGETITIQIKLLDPNTNDSIKNATIKYIWDLGVDYLNETSQGIYQTQIELLKAPQGNYGFDLIITPDSSTYQTTKYSFVVVVSEPIVDESGLPNNLLWIIIGVLISIVSVLGALSYRTYVYLPKQRKIEAKLISKTQRFKDLNNIQAIIVVHKISGIPIYTKSYSILEKHKKELFSGFIQAITLIGEEFADTEKLNLEISGKEKGYGVEKMIELDFKQFYCLIADIEDLRLVLILKERSSDRLKSQVSHLILALNLKLSEQLENWDGSLDEYEILIPEILNEYFELYYKDKFRLVSNINQLIAKKEKSISKMEMRVINVVQSMSKDQTIANLNSIIELVHEENKNLIIEAIESLIKQKLIIPLNN